MKALNGDSAGGVAAAERQLQRIVVGVQHHVADECLVGFDAAGQGFELRPLRRPQHPGPFGQHVAEPVVVLHEVRRVAPRGHVVGGHEDTPRFEPHGVDHSVQALDKLDTTEGGFVVAVEVGMTAGVDDGHQRQRNGRGGKQRKNRIKLGRD